MKIILTGATGFIGKHLHKELQKNGIDVYLIERKGSRQADKFIYDGNNAEELCKFFESIKPDGIIHLASLFLSEHKTADICNLISSNILFGTHLLEAAKRSSTRWFINTGTFWQNYQNAEYSPVNLYAATKESFQDIALYYTATCGLIFSTIKLSDTFGPGDTRTKIFNLWDKIALSGETLGMSAGEQIIDISYIEDVISAYIILVGHMNSGQAAKFNNTEFVVSNKQKVTLKELAHIFETTTSKKLNIIWGERTYREREVMIPWQNGITLPGWEQKYTISDAIKKMYSGDIYE